MGYFGVSTWKSHPGSIYSRVRCVTLFTLTVKCTQVKCRNKVSVILKAHKLFCWLIPSQKRAVRGLILVFGTPSWLHHSSCNFTCVSTVVDLFPSVYFHSSLLFGLSLGLFISPLKCGGWGRVTFTLPFTYWGSKFHLFARHQHFSFPLSDHEQNQY